MLSPPGPSTPKAHVGHISWRWAGWHRGAAPPLLPHLQEGTVGPVLGTQEGTQRPQPWPWLHEGPTGPRFSMVTDQHPSGLLFCPV